MSVYSPLLLRHQAQPTQSATCSAVQCSHVEVLEMYLCNINRHCHEWIILLHCQQSADNAAALEHFSLGPASAEHTIIVTLSTQDV